MTFRIDLEFRRLIPPLQPDERLQLTENLKANGCRDPLVTWHGILIDGHNRYDICTEHRIRFRTVEIALASREYVLLWIEENQLGRRNLTDDQRAAIALAIKKRRAALSRAEQSRTVGKLGGRGKKKTLAVAVSARVSRDRTKDSRPAVAKKARISERKLRAIEQIEKEAGEEAVLAIRAGEKTILETKRELKAQEKRAIVDRIKVEPPPLPEGPFRVIVIDPPWTYEVRSEDGSHRAGNPYPAMTLDQIKALPISKLGHQDSILWLWTTNALMRQAFECLDAWGYKDKSILTWVKDRMGLGDWLRGQTEHCLLAARGNPVRTLHNQTTALMAPLREHSRKPDEFYALVEALCPGSKVELFGRQQRDGRIVWGAEASRFEPTG
jgi:N6-adenosine-specific RNA methylase IME4